jgi:multisubunit Na+/H+ antiporter MnhB subunit
MKTSLARFRKAGSFIAGLLIGLSLVLFAFAMMVVDPSDWQSLWVFGAAITLALGLKLQVVVTTKPRQRRRSGEWSFLMPAQSALKRNSLELNSIK